MTTNDYIRLKTNPKEIQSDNKDRASDYTKEKKIE